MTLVLGSFAILAGGAAVSVALSRAPRLGLIVALGTIVGAAALYCMASLRVLLGGETTGAWAFTWPMPLGTATMALDGLSAWFLFAVGILSIAIAIYSWSYMQGEIGHGPTGAFGALLCLLVGSLGLVICAADAVLFLVAWEIMTLTAFFLVSFHDRQPEVRYAAWMYLVATHLGTGLFLLPMFAIITSRAGTGFVGLTTFLKDASPRLGTLLFILGLLGFGTKAGFMPMHVWLPNAHPVAPTPISALLSGVVIKSGIYGLLRLISWLGPLPAQCGTIMLIFGITSGVLGVLYALAQHDIKRLLAYHSVENIGIIALGMGIGMLGQTMHHPALAALGFAGAILHVLNHALFKGLLFLSAGVVISATGTGELDRLGGLARKMPMNALLFLVAAVSICGLPPFNGFVSEWIIYIALFKGSMELPAASAALSVAALTSLAIMGGLALACFAKVFSVVFLGQPRHALAHLKVTAGPMLAGMIVLAVLCVGIGIAPSVVVPLLGRAVESAIPLSRGQFGATAGAVLSSITMLSVLALVFGLIVAILMWLHHGGKRAELTPTRMVPTWGCGFAYPSARMQYTSSSFAWSLVTSFRLLLWPQRQLSPIHAAPSAAAVLPCESGTGYQPVNVSENHGPLTNAIPAADLPAGPPVAGTIFPPSVSLVTHTLDIAEADVFEPLFRGAHRAALMLKTLSASGRPHATVATDAPRRPFHAAIEGVLAAMRRGSVHTYLAYIVVTLLVLFLVEAATAPHSASILSNPPEHPARSGGVIP